MAKFFNIYEDLNTSSHFSEQSRIAALNRIQEAMQRRKEEITRNINQILEGNYLDRKVRYVLLDLSAPKLLIPDHFEGKNAALIVIDFGKLTLSNRNAFKLETNNFLAGKLVWMAPYFTNAASFILYYRTKC